VPAQILLDLGNFCEQATGFYKGGGGQMGRLGQLSKTTYGFLALVPGANGVVGLLDLAQDCTPAGPSLSD
jgi:hypothetical protein